MLHSLGFKFINLLYFFCFLDSYSLSLVSSNKIEEKIGNYSSSLLTLKVIGAGQGTTGTRSIFTELCQMKLGTFHDGHGCDKSDKSGKKLTGSFLNNLIAKLKDKSIQNVKSNIAEELLHSIEIEIERIFIFVKDRRNKVQALIDSPVSYVFDDLYAASSPDVKVILSVRDPVIWAQSRISYHKNEHICRESALLFNNSKTTTLGGDDPLLPPLPHPFALRMCAKRAVMRGKLNNSGEVVFPFVSLSEYNSMACNQHLVDSIRSKAVYSVEPLADAYLQYNNYIRSVVLKHNLIEVNLWEDDACELHNKLEIFLSRKLEMSYRSNFIGMKVGDDTKVKDSSQKQVFSKSCPLLKTPSD